MYPVLASVHHRAAVEPTIPHAMVRFDLPMPKVRRD